MSQEQEREETYKRIKKRLGEYKYRSGFLTIGTMVFAVLFIFSLFPIIPAFIIGYLGLINQTWSLISWPLCFGGFGGLFGLFQRLTRKIEAKRGITLEELMYVPAYEALCHLREYFDRDHPVMGGKRKAERRIQEIEILLGQNVLPNVAIIRDEAVQLWQLRNNLRMRLIPSMKKYLNNNEPKIIETICSVITALVDYTAKPQTTGIVALNGKMAGLPQIKGKNIFGDFVVGVFRRSNLRHTIVVSLAGVFALLIFYIDVNNLGASMHEALTLALPLFVAIVGAYLTYLGLSVRKEQKT